MRSRKDLCQLETAEYLSNCPICNSNKIKPWYSTNLSFCSECTFHFLNPRPTQEEILTSYNSWSLFENYQKEHGKRTPLWEKRLDIILSYKKSGKLFDVGTGDGFFLTFASEFFEVDAIEKSSAGINIAKKRGFHPRLGGVDTLDEYLPSTYDVITLWHVLEHLPYPQEALEKIYRLLKPGGILVVAVPNEVWDLSKVKFRSVTETNAWPLCYRGMEIHLSYFTPRSFKKILKKNGFKIVDFRVDDIHMYRSRKVLLYYHLNRFLNTICNWHFGKAMLAVAQKPKVPL